MKPLDLVRKLRREAAFEPAALDRGKAVLMAAIRQEVEPKRWPTIVPQVPYQDVAAGARIAAGLRDYFWGDEGHRTYEALDPEGHRWRFHQLLREAPRSEQRGRPGEN